ncbi:GtrA family protein [Patescibacteria group bacterium]|nr:GtrA family protein [Patescibacteria group bacterium]MBU4338090.1 GtrA family protein [Patescibacteria group bacterium]MBU4579792.1 GtrA family protein [Patescibacteria group bacterium]
MAIFNGLNADVLVKNKSFLQFGKFFIVGILNTGLDFGILNLLMWSTNTYEGQSIVIFNTISFAIAVTNSYILNKYWTFGDKSKEQAPQQFAKFIGVSGVGWGLNTGIVYSVTTLISPIFGLGPALWANIAKAMATGVVLAWNFAGYKLFVFKK